MGDVQVGVRVLKHFIKYLVMQSFKSLLVLQNLAQRYYVKFRVIPLKYKFLLFTFLVSTVILYWGSDMSIFGRKKHFIRTSSLNECLKDRLSVFDAKVGTFDGVAYHNPLHVEERNYFPFIGNGYFGCSWQGNGKLIVKYGRSLSVMTNVYPLVTLSVPDYHTAEANVVDFRDGVVLKFQCFKLSSLCISTGVMAFAHRSRPGILAQDIRIYNPTNKPVGVRLNRNPGEIEWPNSVKKPLSLPPMTGPAKNTLNYELTIGTVALSDGNVYLLAVAEPVLPLVVTVKMTDTVNMKLITAIRYSGPHKASEVTETLKKELVGHLHTALVSALRLPWKKLKKEHTDAWNEIWQTGLSLSYSLAPQAVNGDRINATLYYLLSSVPAPLHRVNSSEESGLARRSLGRVDRCFAGHPTILANNLWSDVNSEEGLSDLVTRWMITLEKQGCTRLMKAGADGVIQAAVLSLGGFHFQYDHLEFTMHPNDLHRDFVFRNIHFPVSGHLVTVVVELDEGNRALLYISASHTRSGAHAKLYACDAGCLDMPVEVTKARSQLPIKITRPRTPILYLTSKKRHLEELKHAIHVSDVREAPAHAQHVISLHRHGHALGGLPILFWILLIALVLVFHLFLIKLVYNEYCRGQAVIPPYTGGPAYRGHYRNHV